MKIIPKLQYGGWIQDRGPSGEYGWRNIKTGQFRTTLSNSDEEKSQNQRKQQKAVLTIHSARQARYDRTESKRRNHSDERHKKVVSKPVIIVDKDGTHHNSYAKQLAPTEDSAHTVYPEFDVITTIQGIKPITQYGNNVLKILKLQKSYTGVPARIDYNTGRYMSEQFPEYSGDIWTTTNQNLAKMYAGDEGGKVYTIFGNKKNLAKLPKTPKNSEVLWTDMPYVQSNGKFKLNPDAKLMKSQDYNIKFAGSDKTVFGTSSTEKGWNSGHSLPLGNTTTDNLFQMSKDMGYDGIQFKKVYDGNYLNNSNKWVSNAVDEYVYKGGTNLIRKPFGTTKKDLIKEVRINTIPIVQSGITLRTKYFVNNEQ